MLEETKGRRGKRRWPVLIRFKVSLFRQPAGLSSRSGPRPPQADGDSGPRPETRPGLGCPGDFALTYPQWGAGCVESGPVTLMPG